MDPQESRYKYRKSFKKQYKRRRSQVSLILHILNIFILFLIGIDNICRLLKVCEDKKDCWLIYEVCKGQTMNEGMFNVKGEFYKGERIYLVNHSEFYHSLRNNHKLMIDFL